MVNRKSFVGNLSLALCLFPTVHLDEEGTPTALPPGYNSKKVEHCRVIQTHSVPTMAVLQSLVQNAFQAAMGKLKENLIENKLYTDILSVKSIEEVYNFTD